MPVIPPNRQHDVAYLVHAQHPVSADMGGLQALLLKTPADTAEHRRALPVSPTSPQRFAVGLGCVWSVCFYSHPRVTKVHCGVFGGLYCVTTGTDLRL